MRPQGLCSKLYAPTFPLLRDCLQNLVAFSRVGKITFFSINYNYNYSPQFSITITIIRFNVIAIQLQFQLQLQWEIIRMGAVLFDFSFVRTSDR